MGIGNIGWTEFIVILAFALIFFGPRRLPGIAQAIGKSLREFQKALNEVKSEVAQAGREADARAELKRIMPHPADLMTPESEDVTSSGSETTASDAKSAEASESQEPGPEKTKAQHGDG